MNVCTPGELPPQPPILCALMPVSLESCRIHSLSTFQEPFFSPTNSPRFFWVAIVLVAVSFLVAVSVLVAVCCFGCCFCFGRCFSIRRNRRIWQRLQELIPLQSFCFALRCFEPWDILSCFLPKPFMRSRSLF